MKTTDQSPKFFRLLGVREFRWLFGALEVLSIIGALFVCVMILLLPRISDRAHVSLGEIGLVPESGVITVQPADSQAGTVSIINLRGQVLLNNPGGSLMALTRWYTLPMVVANVAFFVLLLDLLRRLFRNVERGESFTDRNVRLVHKIGMAIIAFTLLSAVATHWHNHAVVTYLDQHATVRGMKMTFAAPDSSSLVTVGSQEFKLHLSWGGIFTGLLVLALGEVFRQGLTLKKESDLTI